MNSTNKEACPHLDQEQKEIIETISLLLYQAIKRNNTSLDTQKNMNRGNHDERHFNGTI